MKKKFLSLLLVAAMAVMAVGCGSGSSTSSTDSSAGSSAGSNEQASKSNLAALQRKHLQKG